MQSSKQSVKGSEKNLDELSPSQYFNYRLELAKEMKNSGRNPYPHKFPVTHQLTEFVKTYSGIETNSWSEDIVSVSGRIFAKRLSSKKLIFYDLKSDGQKIQIMARADMCKEDDFEIIHDLIHRGDIVGFTGLPGRTKKGELSLQAYTSTLLSPCLYMLPHTHFGLKDRETRYRKRYMDLIFNDHVRNIFITKTKIINYLREFLNKRSFLEVETPVMNLVSGGASAKPFITHHNELNLDMFLRIATELPLKKMIIGGFERVYEIGRIFRNEGIDMTHNPEFTTCEFYMAYADYYDLMDLTEELLSGMVYSLHGSYKITIHNDQTDNDKGKPTEIDFTPPFKRIVIMDELSKEMGENFPYFNSYSDDSTREYFDGLCIKHKVECPSPRTTARLIDKLVGHYLEPKIINPTFIINHPQIMSPLAKWNRNNPQLTERFELFVNQKELINAYTELNDPVIQREQFLSQVKDKEAGDQEAQILDEDFCVALEHGLPPTAGWGLGIDRLTMLLCDCNTIKEVILFPTMKPEEINKPS